MSAFELPALSGALLIPFAVHKNKLRASGCNFKRHNTEDCLKMVCYYYFFSDIRVVNRIL